jgi:hypothetical protein
VVAVEAVAEFTCAAERACSKSKGYVNTVAVVPASAPATNRVAIPPPSGSPTADTSAEWYMGNTAKVVAARSGTTSRI